MQVASLAAFVAATSKSYKNVFHTGHATRQKQFKLNALSLSTFCILRHSANTKTEAVNMIGSPSSQPPQRMRDHAHSFTLNTTDRAHHSPACDPSTISVAGTYRDGTSSYPTKHSIREANAKPLLRQGFRRKHPLNACFLF